MSFIEAEPRLQQLWTWWLNVDPTMQQILDDISVLAPQAVAQVLGGPDVTLLTSPEGTKFSEHLWAQLSAASADSPDGSRPPNVVLAGAFRVTNPHSLPGSDLTFQWEEANQGGTERSAEEASHRALVILQDQTGAVVASQEQTFGTPPPGESAPREIVISGVSDGSYWAKLFTPYQDGVESTPGAEAAPAVQVQIGEADANLARGVDNLDTALWAIAQRLATASELAAARDPQTPAEVQQAVADLNELLISIGAQPVLSDRGFGGLVAVDPAVLQSELSRASTALGRFADRAAELLQAGQALNDSRDLADFEAALSMDHPGAGGESGEPGDAGATSDTPDAWSAQVRAAVPGGGMVQLVTAVTDRPGGISDGLASGAERYRALLDLIGADTAVLDRIITSSSAVYNVTTGDDVGIQRIGDLLGEVELRTDLARSTFPTAATERRNLVATQEAQDLLVSLDSLAGGLESWG